MMEVSVEELRERLEYDPETGVIRWRKGVKRGRRAGSIKLPRGYRMIRLGPRKNIVRLYEHRVAWALATGAWPADQIDHRNGVHDDNRLANLRPATAQENPQNRASRARGASGLMGVFKCPTSKNRWIAAMHRRYLGRFGSPEEAHQAYLAAKAQYHTFQPTLRE